MANTQTTWLSVLISFLLLLYAPVVGAAEDEDVEELYGRPAVQLTAGAHYAIEDFSRGEVLSADDSAGLSARIGLRIHRYLSVDANIDFSTGFDASFHRQLNDDVIETGAFTLGARGILPLGRFEPYLSAGLGPIVIDTEAAGSEEVDAAARFGGGIDIYITESIGVNLRAGYMLPLSHLNGFKHAMAGGGVFMLFDAD